MKKRRLLALCLSLCTIGVVALMGCGDSESESSNNGNTDNNEDINGGNTDNDCNHGTTHEHDYVSVITMPTCTKQGYTIYTCACGDAYVDNYVAATGHTYVNRICKDCNQMQLYTRVDASGVESTTGEYILFGSYPQSEVTDDVLTATLTMNSGTLPTATNSNGWTSYEYYINDSNDIAYMWYQDMIYEGVEYRGVYFTSYRPPCTDLSTSANPIQGLNGYDVQNIYWFKYEPVMWRILQEQNGNAFLFCEVIIDGREYHYTDNSQTIDGSIIWSNNYANSAIRAWLNENFYETAFDVSQQQIILNTTIDNSAGSTGHTNNNYICPNTVDKVFLLSYADVVNSAYGFSVNYKDYDIARQKKTTDYAQCQGAWASRTVEYTNNGYWWLRSPLTDQGDGVYRVNTNGYISDLNYVDATDYGVVPALKIRLS